MIKEFKINNRWPLKLPDSSANEWEGNMKYHNNAWELPRLLKLEELIKSGRKNVLYGGAYKGDMCALLASWGADVLMVESTPGFWGIIKKTWDINKLPKPTAFFSGLLSDQDKHLDGLDLKKWPERATEYVEGAVGFTHLAESSEDETFPQATVDTLVERTGFIPNIITMDIEGSELPAMKGALKTMQKYRPDCLISVHPEFAYHNHGVYSQELFDLFENNGYDRGEFLEFHHEYHFLFRKAKK